MLETNLDDMTGEVSGYVMEQLFDGGALDVFFTPIYMKKNRPANKLSILTSQENLEKVQEIIFQETTTLGIRMYQVDRICMDRSFSQIATKYGKLTIKESSYGEIKKYSPEYEDCKKLAEDNNVPIQKVYEAATVSFNK